MAGSEPVDSGPARGSFGTSVHTLTLTTLYSRVLLDAAQQQGIRVFAPARVVTTGVNRIDLADQDRLWAGFYAAAADPLIGLRVGRALQTGYLDVVGTLLATSSTVGDALAKFLTYYPVISEGGSFQLHRADTECALAYNPRYQVCREARVEAALVGILRFLDENTGGRFTATRVSFQHGPQGPRQRYLAELHAPITFHDVENAIWFRRELVELPLTYRNRALHAYLRPMVDHLLQQVRDPHSLRLQVEAILREHMDWHRDLVAEHLHVSTRHLTRRLAHEGTTFKELREAHLRTCALNELRLGRTIGDLAAELGFADDRAFAKAFKRWTGTTPTHYRES